MREKKGISSVVATVLIILVILVAVAIIWQLVIPMIQSNLDKSVDNIALAIETASGYSVYDIDSGKMSIQVKRGNDDLDEELKGIKFIFLKQGESYSVDVYEPAPPNKNQKKLYVFELGNLDFEGKPDNIKISPIFSGKKTGRETLGLKDLSEGDLSDIEKNVYLYYVFETGVVYVDDRTYIEYNGDYHNPIVVASGQTGWDNGIENELTSRPVIDSISDEGFYARILDDKGEVVTGDVGYIVMERGHHIIDGVEVEAGNYLVDSTSFQTVEYIDEFPDDDIVLIDSCQNNSGGYALSSRYSNTALKKNSFSVYWEGYDTNLWPGGILTMGYVAAQTGSMSEIFESGIVISSSNDIDNSVEEEDFGHVMFKNNYLKKPIVFGNPIEKDGGDPSVFGVYNIDKEGFNFLIAEGNNTDIERSHIYADVPWMVWKKMSYKF